MGGVGRVVVGCKVIPGRALELLFWCLNLADIGASNKTSSIRIAVLVLKSGGHWSEQQNVESLTMRVQAQPRTKLNEMKEEFHSDAGSKCSNGERNRMCRGHPDILTEGLDSW